MLNMTLKGEPMSFSFWGQSNYPPIDPRMQPGGYLLILLYVALFGWLLYHVIWHRDELRRLRTDQFVTWGVCATFSIILSNILALLFGPSALGNWGALAVFAGLPIVLAGSVGIVAAATVGFAAGLVRAVWVTHQVFSPFEMAVWGIVTAGLIRQNYTGRLPRLVRLPLLAGPLGALAMWATAWLSCIVYREGNVLETVLLCSTPLLTALPLILVDALAVGLTVQILFLALPVSGARAARRTHSVLRA